jgi:hypothetical protein
MTLKERVIVEAYTGYCMTIGEEREELYKYIANAMGRPIFSHELADEEILSELHDKVKTDFIRLCRGEDVEA